MPLPLCFWKFSKLIFFAFLFLEDEQSLFATSVPEVSICKEVRHSEVLKSPEHPLHVWVIPRVERKRLSSQDRLRKKSDSLSPRHAHEIARLRTQDGPVQSPVVSIDRQADTASGSWAQSFT